MTMFRVFCLLLLGQGALAQVNYSNSISISINEDSLTCDTGSRSVALSLTFINDSQDDILTYSFGDSPKAVSFGLSELCDTGSVGTGIAFALYYGNGNQKVPEFEIVDYFGQKRITREMLDSAIRASNVSFLKSELLVTGHEKKVFNKQISLKDFNLEKGVYYLRMIYYSGSKSLDVFDLKSIKKSKVHLFQGCSMSSKIPLVVN
jgi:hypothetical protein